MTEQYIRYAAMFIIIMMAVIDDYRRFKVSNRIIIAGMVIGCLLYTSCDNDTGGD